VHRDAMSTMRSELPERRPDSSDHRPGDTPRPPAGARHLLVVEAGFVTSIDRDGLLAIAVDEDPQVSLDAHRGSFLVVGTPLGNAWPVSNDDGFESRSLLSQSTLRSRPARQPDRAESAWTGHEDDG
jgi:uncharacterized membrane protein